MNGVSVEFIGLAQIVHVWHQCINLTSLSS